MHQVLISFDFTSLVFRMPLQFIPRVSESIQIVYSAELSKIIQDRMYATGREVVVKKVSHIILQDSESIERVIKGKREVIIGPGQVVEIECTAGEKTELFIND